MLLIRDEHNNEVATEGVFGCVRNWTGCSHESCPRKFAQLQLLARLVLKSFLKADDRGVVELLNDGPDQHDVIGMKSVPHFSGLHKACRRLIRQPRIEQMLAAALRIHKAKAQPAAHSGA
jgi:hypothetical protein